MLLTRFFFVFLQHAFNLKSDCKDTKSFTNNTNKNAENFANMNKRLKQIIDYYNITPYKFSQQIGLSEGTIRKILSANTSIKSENLYKLSQTFTEINLDWLITGRGEMLLSEQKKAVTPKEATPDALQMIADLARENGQLQAENAELKKELARVAMDPAASATAAVG